MTKPDHTPEAPHGYSAQRPALIARLNRIEGQVRGVQKMVEEERYCVDILTQISAVRAALDKVALGLVEDHVHHCVLGASAETRDEKAAEMMTVLKRFV